LVRVIFSIYLSSVPYSLCLLLCLTDPDGFDKGYFEIGEIDSRLNDKSQMMWYVNIRLVKPLDREEITNVFDTLYLYIEVSAWL